MAIQPSYEALQQVYGQQQEPSGIMGLLSSPAAQGLLGMGLGALASNGTRAQAIGRGGLLGLSAFSNARGAQENRLLQMAQAKARSDALGALRAGEDGSISATPAQLIAAGFDDPAKWEALRNYGRDKFKQMESVTNADGSRSLHSVDEYGRVRNTGLSNAPEIKPQDLGGKVSGLNPYTGQQAWSAEKAQTHTEREQERHNRASERIQYGNLDVARSRLALEQNQPRSQAVEASAGMTLVDPRTANVTPPMQQGRTPLAGNAGEADATRTSDANDALYLISSARKLLGSGTTGSALGAEFDGVLANFGKSTKGGDAAEQLRALEGALALKMSKMSEPRSDKDVAMHKQMVGVIGDATIPVSRRLAALKVIEDMALRYAGDQAPRASTNTHGASGSWDDNQSSSAGWSIRER